MAAALPVKLKSVARTGTNLRKAALNLSDLVAEGFQLNEVHFFAQATTIFNKPSKPAARLNDPHF